MGAFESDGSLKQCRFGTSTGTAADMGCQRSALEQRITTLEADIASMEGLTAYQIGYIDGRIDAASNVSALRKRHEKMEHLTIEDVLDHAESSAAGGVEIGKNPRAVAVAALEAELREAKADVERLDWLEEDAPRYDHDPEARIEQVRALWWDGRPSFKARAAIDAAKENA